MIKMKALRSFQGDAEGKVRRGREFGVDREHRARDLETNGLAYRVEIRNDAIAPAIVADAPMLSNKAAESGPLALAGGETGGDAPAPSSPPDRQRRKRRPKASSEGTKPDDLLS